MYIINNNIKYIYNYYKMYNLRQEGLTEERSYRVVIKNLHTSMSTTDIKDELEKKGF